MISFGVYVLIIVVHDIIMLIFFLGCILQFSIKYSSLSIYQSMHHPYYTPVNQSRPYQIGVGRWVPTSISICSGAYVNLPESIHGWWLHGWYPMSNSPLNRNRGHRGPGASVASSWRTDHRARPWRGHSEWPPKPSQWETSRVAPSRRPARNHPKNLPVWWMWKKTRLWNDTGSVSKHEHIW